MVEAPEEDATAFNQAGLDRALQLVVTDRERGILEMRYGLNGHRGTTLEAIGQKLGVTRERVRQLETRAMNKIRLYVAN